MVTISVYMDDGRVFEYEATDEIKAREHAHKIVTQGYRHWPRGSGKELEVYGPHRIDKVKVSKATSSYPDRSRGT